MKEIIKIENLSKFFELHNLGKYIKACQNISFTLHEGEFIGITGKSGSGKSTILKCIYRTYLPKGGCIWYRSKLYGVINLAKASDRQIIHLRKKEIGYVSQFLNVMPRTTAREIVQKAVLDIGYDIDYAKEEAENMLSHFELDQELWDTYPNTFSGGEKLRLNIASAMVKKPRLLLLDEPTASLDNESKKLVKVLLEKLKAKGTSMIGIFHDLEFMEGVCDREFNMKTGNFTV
ncbi:MAG: alpha-D-ribose 1-methylphosphonate 5-triphosphate synthase subunit PhnL [Epulopiscium sp.]|jgi:alpha-D-ribose 1-methylphosphonate 5-triphosphate synthase subunit PhnL|nr:alpha-D-ribose 1-methylphosphonate 5-triphosphate synthase subunit PhnL [Thermoanaerobacterium sp.]MDK2788867.1 alpha-D-ribose 1-methylphosphonate 5-triphosphate synthase subunit PhnL [Candidatus Epulonipiscium sp.]MDK2824477.1 alpha-D-ribose 1-methylphosphonate 5-triphosphate synthase subunit PhnL [Clostridia bacterium]MDN5322827.1 alpha-D-ribose 1-methylphosphonate 5-triphosphate synthase subunit PhnL [Clostridia bacterium]